MFAAMMIKQKLSEKRYAVRLKRYITNNPKILYIFARCKSTL